MSTNNELSTSPNQTKINQLLHEFESIALKLIQKSNAGNFIDAESTYRNFLNHNYDLINQLDVNDKEKFLNDLSNSFINSIGLNLSPSEKTDLINEIHNNQISNDVVNNQVNIKNSCLENKSNGENDFLENNNPLVFGLDNNTNQTQTFSIFKKFRYFLYKFTSISANSGRFSFSLFCASIYNFLILAMTLSSLTPIIATIAHMGWTESQIQERYIYINRYWIFMFIFAWFLVLDWIIRFSYADFLNPYVSTKKAFLSYLFSISNLYQIISVISVIILFFVCGHAWGKYTPNDFSEQVATILFLLNVAAVIPRFAENFFFGKNLILLKKILKSKVKILVSVGIVLIVLLLVFGFIIYQSENAFYIEKGWLNPTTGEYDLNAFNHGEPFETFWEALWYCFVTITTIGYGDYVPYSSSGKVVAVLLAVVGISFFTFIMGILVNIFTEYSRLKKNNENRLKEFKEKNNQLKQFNYLHELIMNDFAKLGLIDKDKLEIIKQKENQLMSQASDVLADVEINNRGNLVWKKQKLGIHIYNNKEISNLKNQLYLPTKRPNFDELNNIIYCFDDIYLRRILRYRHFSVLITKVLGTTNLNKIFLCKKHYNRDVYACLKVATSVIMPKQFAYDAYAIFSQFENKLEFDACFKNHDSVQISLIKEICPFSKVNPLSNYGLKPQDFINYKFISEVNQNNNENIINKAE